MDPRYRRPDGVTDETVAAVGKLSEAMEWVERARGRLYDFHQMMGHADFMLGDAVKALADAGHSEWAEKIDDELVGRNVIDGRWTYQMIDEFDRTYYRPAIDLRLAVEDELTAGIPHVFEAELKDERRTRGRRHHENAPPDVDPDGGPR